MLHPCAGHSLPLPGGGWSAWRTAGLRGAGFAASLVATLNDAETATAADRYHQAEDLVARTRAAALDALRELSARTPASERPLIRARRRRVGKGTVSQADGDHERRVFEALAALDHARRALERAYALGRSAGEDALLRVLADSRFREAAIWQNHHAFRLACRRLSQPRVDVNRQRAIHYLAMLVQRYGAKNDSVGFFGPVGWASLAEHQQAVIVERAPEVIATRNVYFEGWCLDALVDRLNDMPGVRVWAAPRLNAGVWRNGGDVYLPLVGKVNLTAAQHTLLQWCDGQRTADAIVKGILASREHPQTEADLLVALERLAAMKVIVWRLEVAPQLHPERELEERLARIEDADLRATCTAPLAALLRARERVAAAAGQPEILADRLDELETVFSAHAGKQATRRPGETYAARGLVYEDCRRAGTVSVGRPVLERLGPPLSVVLDGARWAAERFGEAMRVQIRRCFTELCVANGSDEVDGHLLFSHVGMLPERTLIEMFREVRRAYQAQWQAILIPDGDVRPIRRKVAEVADRAAESFRIATTWTRSVYFSPDVLIAARGPEAIEQGILHGVLGEVHITNSLLWSALFAQHPDQRSVIDALAADAEGQTVMSVQQPKAGWIARMNVAAHAPSAWRYEYEADLPSLAGCRAAPAGKFFAAQRDGVVKLCARDGSVEVDAVELFVGPVCRQVNRIVAEFLPRSSHQQRIAIGDLVIARERWYLMPGMMPFLQARDPARCYAAARAWAGECRMPDAVFYKSPAERKPCYLDWRSPLYVEIFVKLMKRLRPDAQIRIEEMLPSFDELWLTDALGASYTSELRIVAKHHEAAWHASRLD